MTTQSPPRIDTPYGPDAEKQHLEQGIGKVRAGRIDAAAARLVAARAQLYRSGDGAPVYAREEMREREAALLARFDADVQPTLTEAAREIAEAERVVMLQAGADPLFALPTDDLTRAAALLPFVVQDVATLGTSELLARTQAMIDRRDRVGMVTLQRALQARAAEIDARIRRRSVARGGAVSATAAESTILAAIRGPFQLLTDALVGPTARATRAEAVADATRARLIQGRARKTRAQLDGSEARDLDHYRRQMRGVL